MIKPSKVTYDRDEIYLFCFLRKFSVKKDNIVGINVYKIGVLFDEIAIEIRAEKNFLITERVPGFFDTVKFFDIGGLFGPLWYRDAESGIRLSHKFE